jgi:membrane-associated HD superfamily phosphohydrolase
VVVEPVADVILELADEEVLVVTPVADVVVLPVWVEELDALVMGLVVAVVIGSELVVGSVVPLVLVVDASNTAAAAAITMITTMTTAITIRLIARRSKELFFLGPGEDTKFAMTIALFRGCYHSDA